MAKSKIKIMPSHFRRFVTMDQLAERMKVCRSAIDNAVKRFLASKDAPTLEKKKIRAGKRGPLAVAFRVAP